MGNIVYGVTGIPVFRFNGHDLLREERDRGKGKKVQRTAILGVGGVESEALRQQFMPVHDGSYWRCQRCLLLYTIGNPFINYPYRSIKPHFGRILALQHAAFAALDALLVQQRVYMDIVTR